jgi:hypothetical protein
MSYNSRFEEMSTERKFKIALDETRLLMLGSQIFFGFQFNGIFQSAFACRDNRNCCMQPRSVPLP